MFLSGMHMLLVFN